MKLSRCDEPSSPACPMPMASTILQPTSRARAARAHARTLSFIPLSPPPSLVRSFSSEGVFVRRAPRTQQHGVQASAPARSTPQQHARGVPGRLAPDVHHVRVAVVCGSSRRPRRRHPIDCEHSARTTDHERTPFGRWTVAGPCGAAIWERRMEGRVHAAHEELTAEGKVRPLQRPPPPPSRGIGRKPGRASPANAHLARDRAVLAEGRGGSLRAEEAGPCAPFHRTLPASTRPAGGCSRVPRASLTRGSVLACRARWCVSTGGGGHCGTAAVRLRCGSRNRAGHQPPPPSFVPPSPTSRASRSTPCTALGRRPAPRTEACERDRRWRG